MNSSKFTVLLVLLLSILGCNDGSDSGSPNDPGTDIENLPADPGEAGKTTLQGVDSDSDGIRDDVQIAIYNRLPDDEAKRNALMQKAKALQEAIIAGDLSSDAAINQASESVINAVDCLYEKVDDPSAVIGFLEQTVVNTSDRSDAYIKFNQALSGHFFGGDDSDNPCQE